MRFFPGVLLSVVCLALGSCSSRPALEDADFDALGSLAAKVDTAQLLTTINEVVAEHHADAPFDCASFQVGDESRLCHLTSTRARHYLRARLEEMGYVVDEQVETEVDPAWPTVNLEAELKGTTRPEEIVLIAAHFDSFYGGADDNTSGVAGVLEAARVLKDHAFERTVRFVLFDLEEIGVVGSMRYTKALSPEETIVFATVLECIGYSDDQPGSQKVPLGFSAPDVGDFIAVIGNDVSAERVLEVTRLNEELELIKLAGVISSGEGDAPFAGDLLRSDHAPFWHAGHPAMFLTDTANFRNPNYHTAKDTVDTLDPAFMTGVVKLAIVSTAYWAGLR